MTTAGSAAAGQRRGAIPRRTAFVTVAAVFVAFLAAAAAPSPLFIIYQDEWHFASWLLSLAFAVYAFALLVALLVIGSLSDHLGRRPVIVGAIVLQIVAMTCLLLAPDIGVVLLGRVLQGVATGAATGAMSAALTELAPDARKSLGTVVGGLVPASGLAVGALATGIVVQTSMMPIVIVFIALDVVFVVGLVLVALSAEPGTPRPGALHSLIPHMGVPQPARREFAGYVPAVVADWMTGGLFLGLVAQITRGIFQVQSGLVNGASIAVLCGVGAVSIFLTRNVGARRVVVIGTSALAVGVSVAVASMAADSVVVFAIGTVLAGIGFGTVFAGGIRLIAPLAPAEERGEMFSAIYFVSYLAFGLPVVIAGLLAGVLPLLPVVIGYGALTVACAVVGFGIQLRLRRLDPATPVASKTRPVPAKTTPVVPNTQNAEQRRNPAA